MPQEQFSNGMLKFIRDDEVDRADFSENFRIKWEQLMKDTRGWKTGKERRHYVYRNREGDGYVIHVFAPKWNSINGTPVPLSQGAVYAEILRQHGISLA